MEAILPNFQFCVFENSLYSIKFGERRDYTDAWKKALIDKVRKHELDINSLEVKSKLAGILIVEF